MEEAKEEATATKCWKLESRWVIIKWLSSLKKTESWANRRESWDSVYTGESPKDSEVGVL